VKNSSKSLLFHNRNKDQTNMTKLYTNRPDHLFAFTPQITAAFVKANIQNIVLSEEQQANADFKAKKAHGQFPMLELDDGTVIFESNAIAAYIARSSGNQAFLGSNAFTEA
jgi:glutathione S-transferase